MYVIGVPSPLSMTADLEVDFNDYHEFEIDWKYPKKTYVYDKNMNELGEIWN